jgi:hypothetical protein
MTAHPWLPPMFSVSPWTEQTFEELYAVFRRDLLLARVTYRGFNVWFYCERDRGKEEIFWHLTHREDKSQDPPVRLPDLRRCERLPWVRPMIVRCPDTASQLFDWDHKEGNGDIKTYIWLKDLDFVVIMKKLGDGQRRLITSFYLDYEHQRQKMQKKWTKRVGIALP